jgi:hypothetical protein
VQRVALAPLAWIARRFGRRRKAEAAEVVPQGASP